MVRINDWRTSARVFRGSVWCDSPLIRLEPVYGKLILTGGEVPRLFVAVAATSAIAATSPSTLKLTVAVNWLPKLLDWPLEYQEENGLATLAVTRVV